MDHQLLIQPVIILILWTLVMWAWMYATRVPAIMKLKMRMDPKAPSGKQMSQLPPEVRWKADNYNHLFEQPTIFYAVIFSLALLQTDFETNALIAWCYVVLRIVHSLVQALTNKIELRFAIFVLSNIPLFALCFNAAIAAFN